MAKLVAPMTWMPALVAVPVTASALLTVMAGGYGALHHFRRRKRLDARLVAWLPLLGVLVVTTTASALLVYPREHYLLPLALLGLAALAATARDLALSARLHSIARGALIPTMAVLLVVLPTRHPSPPPWLSLFHSQEPPPPAYETLRTVEVLRGLGLRGHVNILEPDHSRGVYAELDFTRVAQWDKTAPFWPFLHDRQVHVIILNRRLRGDPRFAEDPEFRAFDRGEGPLEDFERIAVSGTDVAIMIRRSVPRGDKP